MASFQAQSLENSLVSLFAATFAMESASWEPKIRTLMETRYNQTLGKLVRDAAKELHLTVELTMELEDALGYSGDRIKIINSFVYCPRNTSPPLH